MAIDGFANVSVPRAHTLVAFGCGRENVSK